LYQLCQKTPLPEAFEEKAGQDMTDAPILSAEDFATLRASPLLDFRQNSNAAQHFYQTLFEHAPDLREMFQEELTDQARKFAATMSVAVHSLRDWEEFKPVLEALARRHLRYGVQRDHYDIVGEALIMSLKALQSTEPQIEIWKKVYGALADHMKSTAYPTAAL
jgi:nitric oxide dioxygenase